MSESDLYVARSGLRKLERITDYKDPIRFTSVDDHLRPLFEEVKAHKASDVYIQEGKPIGVLIQNRLLAITWRIMEKSETQWLLQQIAGQTAITSLANQKAVNTVFGLFDKDKDKKTLVGHRVQDNYRVNASGTMTQGVFTFQIVMRAVPADPYHFSEIGLTEAFVLKCCPPMGIVYISGITGSGKSTTMSSIIRYILEGDTPIKGNIISHEEPIEFTYDNIKTSHSIVVQSQIPECFETFEAATREAMRRKPAAIIVGEIRDLPSIKEAVKSSITGHPVYATIHAGSVTKIISRLVSEYRLEEQTKALYDIVSSTAVLISQRLVRKINGKLMAVQEYIQFTREVREELYQLKTEHEMNRVIANHLKKGSLDTNHYVSLPFAEQGKILYEKGIIDEAGLATLNAGE